MIMDTIIRNIVGRCHVTDSNRTVARRVANAFKGKAWRNMDIGKRQYIVGLAITTHEQNVNFFKRMGF